MLYIEHNKSNGKSWASAVIAAFALSKDRVKHLICAPGYASILRELYPHINLIKDNDVYIASFPRCDK